MRALTFHGPGRVVYEEVADPELSAPGDVVVAVEMAAICGSDLHVYRGHELGLDPGTVLGHEFLGHVVALGSGVETLRIGDRVIAPFSTSCGTCFYCRHGLTARCDRGELFGWVQDGRGLQGVQAESVRVPMADSTLVRIGSEIDGEQALLAGDVLATGIFCAELGGVGHGSVVVVLGCGPVGLMAAVAAKEMGSERVFAIDSVAERRRLAETFGAVALDLENPKLQEPILAATDGRGADVVLEAVGSPAATRLAVDLLRPGGTVAAAGVHTEQQFSISPGEAYDKNLTYSAGRCSARSYMERALKLIEQRRYPFRSLVSHRLPLAEGARGYEIFDRKLESCTKVVLHPPRVAATPRTETGSARSYGGRDDH